MSISSSKAAMQRILDQADVQINGSRPWDVQVHDERLYDRVFCERSLGLGESYMEGWWDAKELDQFCYRVLKAKLHKKIQLSFRDVLAIVWANAFNLQTRRGSLKVIKQHYDLNNDFFLSFLDSYNQYTCGYFKDTNDLEKAQEKKLELMCKKLHLSPKDTVLDIGCGWGGFAKYAATHYGCSVTGITISKEQAVYATEFTKGLSVEIRVQDYRDIQGMYDKVLICGMIEHVGPKNYRTIMKTVNEHLSDSGLFLLHTIGADDSKTTLDSWTGKYIFPNSELPTVEGIGKAIDQLFVMEDWHNFSAYYYPTLMAWFERFDANWGRFKDQYNEEFYRMFKYWLLLSAGSFQARINQLWQVVLSKNGVPGGYQTFR